MSEEKTIVVRRVPVGPGTVLSNTFRIESRIGTGRMAEVFRGHNIQTGDPVAIKVVLPQYSAREDILALFRQEARLIQHLAHDAIARYYLFAVDEATGRAFLAMDYVEGPSLRRQLKSGPLSFEACDVLRRRIADGLQKAHEAGIVHRDISPENIILPDGEAARAKVIDFAIALTGYAGGTTLAAGEPGGKFSYTSPEQLGLYGGVVTARSDIYSFGLVLAEVLSNRPPDIPGSREDLLGQRQRPPDLRGIDPNIRPQLEAMLQPDPALRLATMAEVRDMPFRPQMPVASEPTVVRPPNEPMPPQPAEFYKGEPGKGVSPVLLYSGLAIAVIGASAGAGWFSVQSESQAPVTAETISPAIKAEVPKSPPVLVVEKQVAAVEEESPAPLEPELEVAVLAPPPPPVVEKPAVSDEGGMTDCAGQCPVMVPIPAGRFSMGSGEGKEGPAHEVTVGAFALSRNEITVGQWQACIAASRCRDPGAAVTGGGADLPVRNLTWDDAMAYAAWLSEVTGESYRLPSEAEWEYAARAGTTFSYSGSAEASLDYVDCKDCGGAHKAPAPRGDLLPNAYGLSGMSGGVAEWVMDCWKPTYADAPTDGSARGGTCTQRVLRGGSWRDNQKHVRVTSRAFYDHDVPYPNNGLRIARETRK